MVDDLEEKSPESFDLQHYLGVVRRRHFHFLIPLLLGWAVVWSVSWILAPRYQSATLILVEQPTMKAGNDNEIHKTYVKQLIAGKAERHPSNGNGKSNEQGVFKLTKDPRITRVGAFIRRTSLDELPQFFNVLKGEMSLVGPRPPLPYEVESYDFWHRRRLLEVKPGITGLWQISGRSRVTFDEMVRLDLRYARSWSPWMDIKILLQTPRAMMGEGAH